MESERNKRVTLVLVVLLAAVPVACGKTEGIGEQAGEAIE
jgi:predicted small secreted protein